MGRKLGVRVSIDKGIRRDGLGYEVRASLHGRYYSKRFAADTPLGTMQAWRDRTRRQLLMEKRRIKFDALRPPPPVKNVDGYCYIYFVEVEGRIKIGRATNVAGRLQSMKTFTAQAPKLLVAVIAHASLEAMMHTRFSASRVDGEWFEYSADMERLIDQLRDGLNPAALLF